MTYNLGTRIKELREKSKFTQEQIADYLGINRVTLANIESWKRILKKDDSLLEKIANLYEIEKEELLNGIDSEAQIKVIKDNDHHRKFKNVILYILAKCWQKPNIGKTVLNKLLYFCDFNYYEFKWESITWQDYHKLPRWPVPKDIDKVLIEMEKDNQIKKLETEFWWFKQIRFIPNMKYDLSDFNGLEIEIIDNVIDKLSNMTANQVSEYSHKDIPYIVTKWIWDKINYKHVFSRVWEYIANPENDE